MEGSGVRGAGRSPGLTSVVKEVKMSIFLAWAPSRSRSNKKPHRVAPADMFYYFLLILLSYLLF